MTDNELVIWWRWSKRGKHEFFKLWQLSNRSLSEVIRVLKMYGYLKGGYV